MSGEPADTEHDAFDRDPFDDGLDPLDREHSSSRAVARLAAGTWLRTARWSLDASARTAARLLRAASSPDEAAKLMEETTEEFRRGALQLLGIVDSEGRVAGAVSDLVGDRSFGRGVPERSLRERGEELLRLSADVSYEAGSHPAYERILADLAPDEARILRLLAEDGPQPAVDARAGMAFVPGSRLVLQGFTMLGAEAGLRYVDQVPAYLSNLNRLGLIWFSRDPIRDRERYQVLEVQPPVTEALKSAGRFSHVVRRSIHLSPLGRDFCAVALPVADELGDRLGAHEVPDTA
jgi:hypothetical protein